MKNLNEKEPEFDFNKVNILDENGDVDYDKVYQLFLEDFDSLPLAFTLKNLQLKDIQAIPKDSEYFERFRDSFCEDFRDRVNDLRSDNEVKGNLECSCSHFQWFKDKDEIVDYLREQISETEDDDEINNTEILIKYANKIRSILNDFESILSIYAKQYRVIYDPDFSVSFLASAMLWEFVPYWREWIELQDLTN